MHHPNEGRYGDNRAYIRRLLTAERSLKATLLGRGVDVVWVDYVGANCTGRIENIAYFNSVKPGQVFGIDATTQAGVDALLHTLLNARHPGWSEGDGSYGTFAWDLLNSTLEQEHRVRRSGAEDEVSTHEGFGFEPDTEPAPSPPINTGEPEA